MERKKLADIKFKSVYYPKSGKYPIIKEDKEYPVYTRKTANESFEELKTYKPLYVSCHGNFTFTDNNFITIPNDMIVVYTINDFDISTKDDYYLIEDLRDHHHYLQHMLFTDNNNIPVYHKLHNKVIYMPGSCMPNFGISFEQYKPTNPIVAGIFDIDYNIFGDTNIKRDSYNQYINKKSIFSDIELNELNDKYLFDLFNSINMKVNGKKLIYLDFCSNMGVETLHNDPTNLKKVFNLENKDYKKYNYEVGEKVDVLITNKKWRKSEIIKINKNSYDVKLLRQWWEPSTVPEKELLNIKKQNIRKYNELEYIAKHVELGAVMDKYNRDCLLDSLQDFNSKYSFYRTNEAPEFATQEFATPKDISENDKNKVLIKKRLDHSPKYSIRHKAYIENVNDYISTLPIEIHNTISAPDSVLTQIGSTGSIESEKYEENPVKFDESRLYKLDKFMSKNFDKSLAHKRKRISPLTPEISEPMPKLRRSLRQTTTKIKKDGKKKRSSKKSYKKRSKKRSTYLKK